MMALPALRHLTLTIQRSECGLLQRWFSASTDAASAPSPILLRDYIQDSLYHPVQGYFAREQAPVGKLAQPINFKKLVSEMEYKMALRKLYDQLQVAWLTPVELFQPHYGNAIAKYILETHKHALLGKQDLKIYEIGGGTGTLAKNVLDHIRDKAPQLYPATTYTCLEISARLAGLQQLHVASEGGHARQFRVVQHNAWDPGAWGGTQTQHCFVLMTEVLDNLPHDRVERSVGSTEWLETMAEQVGTQWVQQLRPLQDPLIGRCLQAGYGRPEGSMEGEEAVVGGGEAGSGQQGGDSKGGGWGWLRKALSSVASGDARQDQIRYLPTACLALLDLLHTTRPHHTLLAADFNTLPDVRIPGTCAPLVSSLEGGQHTDHDTIFVPRGSADIFFPTDFEGLCRLYHQSANVAGSSEARHRSVRTSHSSTAAFMQRFAEYPQITTLTGYNPLLQDFSNTSLLLASSFEAGPSAPADAKPAAAKRRGASKKARSAGAKAGARRTS